ncbi:YdcF family protein [Ferruginibacter lapsinanis]|uniref:YdcF family protein n=1 Tax=Ferruginibacter lapsinanis TaxID=563172 RepID=UPI001E37B6A5|nr:ElyC/SanA/YdcF family protein [Ferruginibacter lapsinanis]UEG50897.1 YdcF family protein [Ferruginibacter lapsinanis]
MHLIASTIIGFFISPINWIILLTILSFYLKSVKVKKICRLTALGLFLVFSNIWLLTAYAKFWQPAPRDVSKDSSYSCGILLGGFASPDENEKGYFNGSSDRFIQTVKLYKLGKIKHIFINGGNGKINVKNFNEGEWVKGELNAMGIPDTAILYEDKSANTTENAINSKKILDSAKLAPPYLLITSAFHVPRASLLFNKAGVNTVAFPCSYGAGRENYRASGILPQPEVLIRWDFYIKETVGYLIYKIKG